jgi:RNA polymerase sigma-B factor
VQRITPRGERELFERLRAAPSPAHRNAAVARYLPLAQALAARYRSSVEPIEDLEQVAAVGLLKAIDRFDPDRGTAFASFAVPTILGELRRHFRDCTWALRIPRVHQELLLRLERTRDELTAALGHQPTIAELSRHLGAGEELVLHVLELASARHTFPLAPDDDDAEGIVDAEYGRVEDRATLTRLLGVLSAGDAEIVRLRFGADLTQEVIARRLGVSQMYVSRALRRSLTQLRDAARP